MSNITVGIDNSDLYITVEGRGTVEYCSELNSCIQEALSSRNIEYIYFDTKDACYLDSSFIGIILSVRKKLSCQKDKVFLLNPSDKVVDIFKLMGLESFIPSLFDIRKSCADSCVIINKKTENSIADIKLLLDSHKRIMETSVENYKRFALVEKVFQKELAQKQMGH